MLITSMLVEARGNFHNLTTELATNAANKLKKRYLIRGLLVSFLRNALYAQGTRVIYTPIHKVLISEEPGFSRKPTVNYGFK